jgi:hypothetical protein
MRPQVYFIGEAYLKKHTVIGDNIDGKMLRQCIESVQEEKILPALGTALYNKLITGIDGSSLTADEQSLLDNYIQVVMKWYVLAEMPIVSSLKFTNKGVQTKTSEQSENPSMSEIFSTMKYYKQKAEFQENRMIKYLQANASATLFPEYLEPGDGCDTVHPKNKGYTCPIVLDDTPERSNGYDYE